MDFTLGCGTRCPAPGYGLLTSMQVMLDVVGLFLPCLVSILSTDSLGTNQKWCTLPSVRCGLKASPAERLLLHFLKKPCITVCALPGLEMKFFHVLLKISVTYGDIFKPSPCWRVRAVMSLPRRRDAGEMAGGAKIKLHWPNFNKLSQWPWENFSHVVL